MLGIIKETNRIKRAFPYFTRVECLQIAIRLRKNA